MPGDWKDLKHGHRWRNLYECCKPKYGGKVRYQDNKHLHPYNLRWLNNKRQLKFSKQVLVPFKNGRYEDEVMYDVLPMEAGHILLGRPWQYNHKGIHDCFTNKHSFKLKGRKIILAPLSPREVYLDRIQLEKSSKGKSTQSDPPNTSLTKNESESSSEPPKKALINKPMRRETLFVRPISTTKLEPELPSNVSLVLQEYTDVFPEYNSGGLPPIRGIEHKIDFIPGASLPNRSAYRTNPVETKELQRQVDDLMEKGYIRESMSPCAVPVLLVPKKMGPGKFAWTAEQ
ncbi:uncharacterized protein LOC112081975 [Eutrema salsugineum]|uniref:uncharacterized protein LOC112081975 n=1 Tax=Eutrema salsugineum TaxID=72664 RepID=UPI000CED0655|nr:uncharacterized protein LOC112081975 [Eutrema salsugineum]